MTAAEIRRDEEPAPAPATPTDPPTGAPTDALTDEQKQRLRGKAQRSQARRRREKRGYRTLLAARAVVRRLPLPVAAILGHATGTLAWYLMPAARRKTLGNLEIALGREMSARARRRIGRRSFAHLGRGVMSFAVLHRMGADRALRLVEGHGVLEALSVRAPAAPGDGSERPETRGALFVTFHYGLFELFAAWLADRTRLHAVGREAREMAPTGLLIRMREEMGCPTIQRGNPRDILRVLREGGTVGFLVDQDVSDIRGVFVPVFGTRAHTPIGPATFAVRTGLPVVFGVIEWTGLTTHRAMALPPMFARRDLSPDDAALELTARITKAGEDAIRRRPDHWVWMHRRWETRPESHPDRAVWPPERA